MTRDELRARMIQDIDSALNSWIAKRWMSDFNVACLRAERQLIQTDDGYVDKINALLGPTPPTKTGEPFPLRNVILVIDGESEVSAVYNLQEK